MNRLVDEWNKLIKGVVNANTTESFKCRIDEFIEEGRWTMPKDCAVKGVKVSYDCLKTVVLLEMLVYVQRCKGEL